MGSDKDLSREKKVAISTLLEAANLSQREIAKRIGVSKRSVSNIAKMIRDGTFSLNSRPSRLGLYRATTPREDLMIRDVCLKNRKEPLRNIGKEVRASGINISDHTIDRRLHEFGFKCRRPAKKPLLNGKMMKKRLAWAKNHRNMTEHDWDQVK